MESCHLAFSRSALPRSKITEIVARNSTPGDLMHYKKLLASMLIASGLFSAAVPAQAALIYLADETLSGSGLGAVNTVLTISSPSNSGTETGSVKWNGAADVKTGDVNAAQTQTRSLAELSLSSSADLRVVFNAAEPASNSITLTDLVLYIFSAGGTQLFQSGAFTSVVFTSTGAGTGSSGFVFGFDPADISNAAAAFGTSSNRIGLQAMATDATGGQETFFVALASNPGGPGNNVPEPSTIATLGLGLLGMGFAAKRKAGKQG